MKPTRLGVFALVLLVGGAALGGLFGPRVLAGGNRLSDQLRLYTSIVGTIEENYAEEVKSDRLVSSSIREMLRTLDPHSNFFEAKEYTSLQERQKGSYYGLGITVQSVDGNITVVSPFEGTPAHRLGIRAGDVISRIEAEDARGMTIDDAVKRLRGSQGDPRPHHDPAPGLRGTARVHGHSRRDPPPLGALLVHGVEERSGTCGSPTSTRPPPADPARVRIASESWRRRSRGCRRAGPRASSSTSATTRAASSTSRSRCRTSSSRRASSWSSPADARSATSRTTSPRRRAPASTCPSWC